MKQKKRGLKRQVSSQSEHNSTSSRISRVTSRRNKALRQAAEQKRLDELKKFEITPLRTNLELFLNVFCVQEAWKAANPKEYFISFLQRSFALQGLQDNFESLEIYIIAEFHQINLFFAKQNLLLNDFQTPVLLNILWQLLKNKNPSYQQSNIANKKMTKKALDKMIQKDLLQRKSKNAQEDMQSLKRLIISHSVHKPPKMLAIFTPNQVRKIIKHVQETYISHYDLYYHVLTNRQKNEEINFDLIIDVPKPLLPLHQALPMGRDLPEIPDEADNKELFIKQLQQVKQKQDQIDGDNGDQDKEVDTEQVDPTKALIDRIGKNSEVKLLKKMQKRSDQLDEEADDIINPKKDKKK